MRTPLDEMYVRTASLDQTHTDASITSRLSHAASPIGGSFGPVRSSGTRPHQGWDIYAPVGTLVYSIAPGVVEFREDRGAYGLHLCIRIDEEAMSRIAPGTNRQLWAFYAHLSATFFSARQAVIESDVIGLTGNSGNAGNTPPHLHFEIRTQARPPHGLIGRIDPGEVLGYAYYMSRPAGS
jgi:murein DD-endopeptidase MepM/ murein hydrolase activator NlpD